MTERGPKVFERILEHVPAVVWERDASSLRFTYVSPEARRLLGYEPEAWYADDDLWSGCVLDADRAGALASIREAVATGHGPDLEYRMHARDGRTVWVRDIGALVTAQGRPLRIYGVLLDNSASHTFVDELRRRERRLSLMNDALAILAREGTLQKSPFSEALRRALEVDAHALDVARVGYWALDEDDTRIRCVDLYDRAAGRHSAAGEIRSADQPAYFAAAVSERVVAADDARADPRTRQLAESYLRPLGITSMLDAPVRKAGRVVGVLCHEQIGPIRTWTPEEMQFAGSMADLITLALETEARREAETQSRVNEARFRGAFEETPCGAILFDSAQRILAINAMAERDLRLARADAPGRQVGAYLDIGALCAPDACTFPTTRAVVRRADGTSFPADVSGRRLPRNGDDLSIVSLVDVSPRVEAEAEVERYRRHLEDLVRARTAELERANSELEAFNYSVSHDLRAPLRAIEGYAHLLADQEGPAMSADGRRQLERICVATRRMSGLIEDLLRLARVGRSQIREETVDVSALVREIADELHRASPERDVQLTVVDGLSLHGDEPLLRIVFENLLGNAWKFTARNPVAHVTVGSDVSTGGQRQFFVRDDGIGIDASGARGLFEPFRRLPNAEGFEGTGLGLAIVRRAIERLGGRIWIDAPKGPGATIRFTLP